MQKHINTLLAYLVSNKLIEKDDLIYYENKLDEFLNFEHTADLEVLELNLEELLDYFISYAVDNKIINDNNIERDLFDTRLMSLFVDRPSNIISKFNSLYSESKKSATDYFYSLEKSCNYIRTARINKDIKWQVESNYGLIDISINLSKPEKDPKMIAKLATLTTNSYPTCLLCKENEGFTGRLNHPARGNLRLIPITLANELFYLQYSPYSYFNEHAIILNEKHKPMVIEENTFRKLLEFVKQFPHYFIGSNADLPIVGGSILAHEHFQGGNTRFPMDNAKSIYDFKINGYNVNLSIIKWPLSTIKIEGNDLEELVKLSTHILNKWIEYSNIDLEIYAYTNNERHNTITPIFRYGNNHYVGYLVLRNNYTNEAYPLGLYHPHQEYHHIKKENIGLIEVMGLAILPARLKNEMELLKKAILNNEDIQNNVVLSKHYSWVMEMKSKYSFNQDNIDIIIKNEIGIIFTNILENAGVFKQNENGINAFIDFVKGL